MVSNLRKKIPLVSVVIPTFNRAYCIQRCINSVLNQSYKNLECIVIDNNSNDNSNLIFEQYKDNRLKIYKINNNGIIAKSRNLGISKSKGEVIAFLDSDDWWEAIKVEICINEINKGYDFIYHDLIIKDFSGKKRFIKKKYISSKKLKPSPLNYFLFKGNPIPLSSTLIRKKKILDAGKFDEDYDLVGAEDFYLWINIALQKCKFKNLNIPLGYYTINNDSFTSSAKSIKYFNKIFRNLYDKKLLKSFSIKPWARLSISFILLKENKYKESFKNLLKSIITLNYIVFLKSIFLMIVIIFKILSKFIFTNYSK